MAPLRYMADAHLDNLGRMHMGDFLVPKQNPAGFLFDDVADGAQGGGLSCPIGTDQAYDLVFVHMKAYITDRMDMSVIHNQMFNRKHGICHHAPS